MNESVEKKFKEEEIDEKVAPHHLVDAPLYLPLKRGLT
jgi:hypothetical protein